MGWKIEIMGQFGMDDIDAWVGGLWIKDSQLPENLLLDPSSWCHTVVTLKIRLFAVNGVANPESWLFIYRIPNVVSILPADKFLQLF